jgi:small subunit ribosomal protein S7
MPRKGPAPKRPLVVDPVYASPLVTQLVNKILLDGKKSIAETIVYGALEGCRQKTGTDPVATLKRALDNVKPAMEVKSRRVGGATYQVPIEVKPGRSTTLALRWLVGYSRQRREKTMTERLMNEILDASNGLGAAVKRREDTHKMAESNKAFAHYRWCPRGPVGLRGSSPHGIPPGMRPPVTRRGPRRPRFSLHDE